MTFTVTYRGAKGAPVTEAVEAADRAECLAQLKKRGIAPTSVKEGDAKQDKKAAGGKAKPTGGNSVAYVLLVACALLAVLGGIWLFGRGKEQPSQDGEVVRKPSALAKEVKPAKAAKPLNTVAEEPTAINADNSTATSVAASTNHITREAYDPLYPLGRNAVITNTTMRKDAPYRIFKHYSENELATFVSVPLGTTFRGDPHYGPRLAEDFKRSLEEPIVYSADDTEDELALKKAINELKADLKVRMDAGEDIVEIFRQTRKELQEFGIYRQQVEQAIRAYRKNPEATDADIDGFIAEANKMLEAKGIAPIQLSEGTRAIIRHKVNFKGKTERQKEENQ